MEPVQYLRALRQWWWVIVASVVIGVALAVVAVPGSSTEYQATQTLLAVSSSSQQQGSVPSLEQMAFLVPRGDVLTASASALGESPSGLAARVTAVGDSTSGTLTITATGKDPGETAHVADAFANGLISTIDKKAKADYDAEVSAAEARVAAASAAVNSAATEAQRQVANDTYTSESQNLLTIRSQGPATAGLERIEKATASPTSSGTGRTKRALIAGAVGFLIGAGLALMLTRFDSRLHTREAVELAFGVPVIGEIPLVSRRKGRLGNVVVHVDPDSPASEAYRNLRSTLLLAPRNRRARGEVRADRGIRRLAGDHMPTQASRADAIMVVSPGVGEGKSTCVANLAAAFAESGKRVIVLSCDLRRPAIDRYLGAPENNPGVSDLLVDGGTVSAFLCETSIPNVKLLPSGRVVSNPGELLTHGEVLLSQARELADVIVVDTPPVLATDDVSAMIPAVDDVVIVCRCRLHRNGGGAAHLRAPDPPRRINFGRGDRGCSVTSNGSRLLPRYVSKAPERSIGVSLPVDEELTHRNGAEEAEGVPGHHELPRATAPTLTCAYVSGDPDRCG